MTSADDTSNHTAPSPATDGLTAAYAAQDLVPNTKAKTRIGLWILLGLMLLNVALWLGYTSSRSVWGHSSETAAQSNFASEKIVLSAMINVKAQAVTNTSSLTATSISTETPVSLNTVSSASNNVIDKTACMVWAFANSTEAKRADNRMVEQAWQGYTTDLADEPPTYMAFVGPFASQSQTDAMMKTMAKLKIKDYSLLPSGSIALGVVATREAGQQLQQRLTNRGLKDVQLVERQGKGKLKRYRFEQMTPASLSALRQLSEGLGTLTECSKP